MCSDAPDTSGINAAASANAEIAKDALSWYKSAYEDQKPLRDAAAAKATEVADLQMAQTKQQMSLAEGYDKYRKEVYEPLERDIVADARNFDTEGKREELAGLALGDVNASFDSARSMAYRDLTRRGVDPLDGSAKGAMTQLALKQAMAGAGAKNEARQQAITLAGAKKMDAANLGRNLPSNQSTAAGIALNSGNAAVGNAQVPVSLAQSATSQAGDGYRTAIAGNSSAGNLYGSAANIQGQNDDSAIWGAVGKVAGSFIASDKNQKRDRKPVKGEVALSAARRMPVQSWKYKESSPANDGGKKHVGPMAQDVQAALGDAAAPGGKKVDLISLAGVTLAAVQELDKKVHRIEAKRR